MDAYCIIYREKFLIVIRIAIYDQFQLLMLKLSILSSFSVLLSPLLLLQWDGQQISINMKLWLSYSYCVQLSDTNRTPSCDQWPEEACYKRECFSRAPFVLVGLGLLWHTAVTNIINGYHHHFYCYHNRPIKYRDWSISPTPTNESRVPFHTRKS